MKTFKYLLVCVLMLIGIGTAGAEETPNAKQARHIFDKAYNMIYGHEGASFHYRISILKIHSEEGTGWYKGNKSKCITENSIIWDNGDIKYILKKGKNIVEIHDPKVNKKDKLLQKFKLYPEDFNYSIAREKNDLIITLKAKSNAKGSMKHIQIYLEPGSYKPKRLRIKVLFFWANIYFSDFKAGGIDDDIFTFPKEKYANYKLVDER